MTDKEKLQKQMYKKIDEVLDEAEKKGTLHHWKLEMCNNNGQLQSDYTIRDRERVY